MNNGTVSPSTLLDELSGDEMLSELSERLGVPESELDATITTLREMIDESSPESNSKTKVLKVDGASRGNPGPGGAGAVLLHADGTVIKSRSEFLGKSVTNNEAEYRALLLGLELLTPDTKSLKLLMDSELAVKQLQGHYQVKSEGLRPYYERAKRRMDAIESLEIEHIPREENEQADKLANEAIDKHERRESVG